MKELKKMNLGEMKKLSRNEMKSIMAGSNNCSIACDKDADCAGGSCPKCAVFAGQGKACYLA